MSILGWIIMLKSPFADIVFESEEHYFLKICEYIVEKSLFHSGARYKSTAVTQCYVPKSVLIKRGISLENFLSGRKINLSTRPNIYINIKGCDQESISCTFEDINETQRLHNFNIRSDSSKPTAIPNYSIDTQTGVVSTFDYHP